MLTYCNKSLVCVEDCIFKMNDKERKTLRKDDNNIIKYVEMECKHVNKKTTP